MTAFTTIPRGQRVKVRGASVAGRFHAVEVEMRPEDRGTLVEAVVERFDAARREAELLGTRLRIPEGVTVADRDGAPARLEDAPPRTRMQIAGRWAPETGFVPDAVRLLETRDFNIEKIQGPVEAVDAEARTLRVLGFTIEVEPRTAIEGAPR
jgi:hypothetical protein